MNGWVRDCVDWRDRFMGLPQPLKGTAKSRAEHVNALKIRLGVGFPVGVAPLAKITRHPCSGAGRNG